MGSLSFDRREIFKMAEEKWGVLGQVDMAAEECAELIVAIHHAKRRGDWHAVMEEVADVEIMMEQMRQILDSDVIDRIRSEKLKRLHEMVTR
jgi:NTP pyrophosphatase (non-canonical NTP hydrolase)